MADVKESALSTANDCAYVRALDSNGNSIRISKSDLASVVGGLLSNAIPKSVDIGKVVSSNYDNDLNNIPFDMFIMGVKGGGMSLDNAPFGELETYFIHAPMYYNSVVQQAFSLNRFAFRVRATTGAWSDWKEIAFK